jgi:hypothetical protein
MAQAAGSYSYPLHYFPVAANMYTFIACTKRRSEMTVKKIPILDLLSLIVILAIGFDLHRMHGRIDRLEQVEHGAGDALDAATLLPMPAATLTGKQITVDRGQPRLIFYMSPHCGVCAKNMPEWSSIAHQIGPKNALFVLANPGEMPLMPAYLAKYDLGNFPTISADPDVVGRYYLLQVPKTVLVGADGKVAKVWRGVVTAGAVLQGWNSNAKQVGGAT